MWQTVDCSIPDTTFCNILITIMQVSPMASSNTATPVTGTAQLLRPLQRLSVRRASLSPTLIRQTLHCGSRPRFTCSASEHDQQKSAENDVRPEVSKTKLGEKGAETEVPKLGLPGTIATWALLIVSAGWTFSDNRSGNIYALHLILLCGIRTLLACRCCLEAHSSLRFQGPSCQICNPWTHKIQS